MLVGLLDVTGTVVILLIKPYSSASVLKDLSPNPQQSIGGMCCSGQFLAIALVSAQRSCCGWQFQAKYPETTCPLEAAKILKTSVQPHLQI